LVACGSMGWRAQDNLGIALPTLHEAKLSGMPCWAHNAIRIARTAPVSWQREPLRATRSLTLISKCPVSLLFHSAPWYRPCLSARAVALGGNLHRESTTLRACWQMSTARPRGCIRQREQLPWERHPPINSIVPPASSKSSMKATKLSLTEESTLALPPALELIVLARPGLQWRTT